MGSFASIDGKEGRTTMLPDGDRDVKLEWAEGGSSDYVKLNRLRKSNESNFINARPPDPLISSRIVGCIQPNHYSLPPSPSLSLIAL